MSRRRNVVYEDEAGLSGSDSGDDEMSQDSAGSLKDFIVDSEDDLPSLNREISSYDVLREPSPTPEHLLPPSLRRFTPGPLTPVQLNDWTPHSYQGGLTLATTLRANYIPTPLAVEEDEDMPETSSNGKDRVRRFTMTLNNFTDVEKLSFETLPTKEFKYSINGVETGTNETPHLQAYLETKNKHTIAGLQKLITKHQGFPSRWAIFVSLGSAGQNITYCKKQGNFKEVGDIPKGQGKRTDLDSVAEMVKSGSNMRDIAEAFPKSFIHYSKGIQNLMTTLNSIPRSEMTLGYWIFGATGTGKSRWAHSLTPDSTYVKDPTSKWFCGYSCEETVIIDDFRPSAELPFSFLLRIADRYKMSVQTKGGQVNFNSKRVIITSPHNIETTFAHLDFLKEGDIAQLKRRFKELEFGPGKLSHLVTLVGLETSDVVINTV